MVKIILKADQGVLVEDLFEIQILEMNWTKRLILKVLLGSLVELQNENGPEAVSGRHLSL